eukprot:Clim_evm7s242 gene=Clim_evmTU7s242
MSVAPWLAAGKAFTYTGTLFEEAVLSRLSSTNWYHLNRAGGAGDKGLDIIGSLYSPKQATEALVDETRAVNVAVQCKLMGNKLGPMHVRDFAGAVSLLSLKEKTLGILATSQYGFSRGAIQALNQASVPLIGVSYVVNDVVEIVGGAQSIDGADADRLPYSGVFEDDSDHPSTAPKQSSLSTSTTNPYIDSHPPVVHVNGAVLRTLDETVTRVHAYKNHRPHTLLLWRATAEVIPF